MEYVLSRFIHRLNQNKVLIQRHTLSIPLTFRLSPELDAASIQRRLLFLFLMLLMRLLIEGGLYLVGPYYASPKSTPAHFTPALIPPRANFDLPPFRAAFKATIGKKQKNQKKGKVFNLQ